MLEYHQLLISAQHTHTSLSEIMEYFDFALQINFIINLTTLKSICTGIALHFKNEYITSLGCLDFLFNN